MNWLAKIAIVLIIIVVLLLIYFYRKPNELIRKSGNAVYSPAYGRIMDIREHGNNSLYIAIFLSPLDIHYQFAPVSGTVKKIDYDATGKFALAYELNKSNDNEKCIYSIDTPHGMFQMYQIAGFLVRRITSYVKENQVVDSGKCMGLIHFGSRVDLLIPKRDKFKLLVQTGDYVSGSETTIGHYE